MAKGVGIMGITLSNGCLLAQVQVDGVRHRRTFGKHTGPNLRRAVAWLEGMRAGRTAELPAGTAERCAKGSAEALARIDAWEAKRTRSPLTMAERIAANKKADAQRRAGRRK